MKTLKHILKNVPKSIRWLILTIFIARILDYLVIQFFTNKPVEFSIENITYIISAILFLTFLGYIIGSYNSISKLLKQINSNNINTKPQKEKLPHRNIIIGTYKSKLLSSDIRAKIFLNEKIKPNVDVFLDRVFEGNPFCTKCLRPLDIWSGNYITDIGQIGYKCSSCKTEIEEDFENLRKSIKSLIRRDYDKYWDEYQKQIKDLTGGKPELFETPLY